MNETTKELLRSAKVLVSPETFSLVRMTDEQWRCALAEPGASPRMSVPFMILRDNYEITLMLDDIDASALTAAVPDAKRENGFRLLTFDVELGFSVTGFIAEIARVLAAESVPIVAVSSFSRDHLLIKQTDLAKALRALAEIVEEVC